MSHVDKKPSEIAFLHKPLQTNREIVNQAHRIAQYIQWPQQDSCMTFQNVFVMFPYVLEDGWSSLKNMMSFIWIQRDDGVFQTDNWNTYIK